ncbi:putative reverse transcriptase domain-containing protein [Tanacetum coccineum]|uniref:Reverse transcriptase domain-containing protein n=1 Tax=Tanacetum coccineum TaxID=301880 RepID=A0ABQ5HAM6_9ASTR
MAWSDDGSGYDIVGMVVMRCDEDGGGVMMKVERVAAGRWWCWRSRDCKNPPNVNTRANQRACFECGAQGHFKKDCPKWKNNNNRGNQAGNAKAQAKVYAVGNAGANPDNNVVTDEDKSKEKQHEEVPVGFKNFRSPFPRTCRYTTHSTKWSFKSALESGCYTLARAPYRIAPSEMKELSGATARTLDGQRLHKTKFSPWGAPFLLVKKKDRSFGCASMYRELNN